MEESHDGLIVYGAGGHATVVLDAALLGGARVEVLFDDAPKVEVLFGVPVRLPPKPEASFWSRRQFIVAIGDNQSRNRVFTRLSTLGARALNVVHPRAFVSPHARLGAGVFLAALAVVNPGSQVGDNCILNTASSVDHDCQVGPDVHVCPGVRLAGGVVVGASSFIGTGASILPGVQIGAGCVIGAGAVVCAAVPDYSVAVGVPARVVRRMPPPSQAASS